jgi:hypothetical protein
LTELARGLEVLTSVADLIFCAVVAGAMGVTVRWLFQTLAASGQIARQNLLQAQSWLFQQQQQSASYGYGAVTGAQPAVTAQGWLNLPPPPPPASPPPAQSAPQPPLDSTSNDQQ